MDFSEWQNEDGSDHIRSLELQKLRLFIDMYQLLPYLTAVYHQIHL